MRRMSVHFRFNVLVFTVFRIAPLDLEAVGLSLVSPPQVDSASLTINVINKECLEIYVNL